MTTSEESWPSDLIAMNFGFVLVSVSSPVFVISIAVVDMSATSILGCAVTAWPPAVLLKF